MNALRRSLGLAALLTLSGCAGIQSALDPAGREAGHLFSLWNLMLVVCGVMYALVLGFLALAIWRRRRPLLAGPETQVDDKSLERVLVGWGVLIVAGLVVLVVASFAVDRALFAADMRNALKVKVTGNQWWWRIEYQDGPTDQWLETANELHLPAGRPVRLTLASNDVIHSFWTPNLNGKIDLVPGRENHLLITPHRVGEYRGQCAEFCGLQHAHMALAVTVETPARFEAWRARQLQPAPEPSTPETARGRAVFQNAACSNCHRIDGTQAAGRLAPNLTHVASRKMLAAGALTYSRGALQGWIANPKALKPGTTMPAVRLTSAELNALSAYLDTLK